MADPTATPDVTPFVPRIEDAVLDDLRLRLDRTRLPEAETAPGQGLPLADVRRLLERWRDGWDADRLRRRLASVPQVRTTVDGLDLHAIHVRSVRPDAIPLLLGHGWPSTCFEFLDALPLLTAPASGPAFHVVCPSLPGHGFSGRPTGPGWGAARTADASATLMARLGYDRYVVQGGDWGSVVGTQLAVRHPASVLGLHLTMPVAPVIEGDRDRLSAFETDGERRTADYRRSGFDYARLQRSRPQTLGYGLVDSPVALLAWIAEKLLAWSDVDHAGGSLLGDDAVLDVVTTYWATATGASAARFYAEALSQDLTSPVPVPTGCSIFAAEVVRTPRSAVARRYRDLRSWTEVATGGHFAALEVPAAFADEVRSFAARLG